MADSDLQINIKTIAEVKAIEDFKGALEKAKKQAKELGQDVTELEVNLKEVDAVLASNTVKSLKYAEALDQLGEKAKAIKEAKDKADQLGAESSQVGVLVGNLGARLASFATGAAISAGVTLVIGLFAKLGTEVRNILDQLDIFPTKKGKVDEVSHSLTSGKTQAEQYAEAVRHVAEAFDHAARKADDLRKKQDELDDAKTSASLAGIDVLESLGPGRGGISSDDARLRRTSLRLENARSKNAREAAAITQEENIIKGQQAGAASQLNRADFLQSKKDRRREALLSRASKILQVPVEQLRDPEVFDREYNAAINRASPDAISSGDLGALQFDTDRDTPADSARRGEVESVKDLSILLRSPNRRIERARDRLNEANDIAKDRLPELERRRQVNDLRGVTAQRGAEADVAKLTGEQSNLLTQLNGTLQGNFKNTNELLRAIIQQQQLTDRELNLLKNQTRFNNPWR
jgi:hypothetical protein